MGRVRGILKIAQPLTRFADFVRSAPSPRKRGEGKERCAARTSAAGFLFFSRLRERVANAKGVSRERAFRDEARIRFPSPALARLLPLLRHPLPQAGEGKSSRGESYVREYSASLGSRPCGVYLSTASGSSRESRATSSSFESPVCLESAANTSGPIACSSCDGAICLFGPVPTQESTVSP